MQGMKAHQQERPAGACAAACTVEALGDDRGGAKAQRAPFFSSAGNARVTLSCTGTVLPTADADGSLAVLVPASLLAPFLQQPRPPAAATAADVLSRCGPADLAPGTELTVTLLHSGHRARASLRGFVRCPQALAQARRALRDLNQGAQGGGTCWHAGWWLERPVDGGGTEQAALDGAALLATWAILTVDKNKQQQQQQQPEPLHPCACSRTADPIPGRPLVLTGSPFGCLAPHHFAGSVVGGCVSNVLPPAPGAPHTVGGAPPAGLFLVDAHAYPGMEGSPVTCRDCGGLLGLLTLPLTTAAQHCEVPVAVAASELMPLALSAVQQLGSAARASGVAAQACSGSSSGDSSSSISAWQQLCPVPARHLDPSAALLPADPMTQCQPNVLLVRVSGSWATGVALSDRLVLTNAHLLPEPRSGSSKSSGSTSAEHGSVWVRAHGGNSSSSSSSSGGSVGGDWVPAEVLRRFSGYLDVAVLRLLPPRGATPPPQLTPFQLAIKGDRSSTAAAGRAALADTAAAAEGSDVFVVGHGLFAPRMGWAPSVTRGSLARRVALPCGRPSMLVVTAAVHAGASGGALVDGSGRLLGLVTSNTRHHRGATLPRWSFAIAAEELAPLWAWAADAATVAPDGSRTAAAWRSRLAALDLRGADGDALWALRPPPGGAVTGGTGATQRQQEPARPLRSKL